jgi:hypothetical protein
MKKIFVTLLLFSSILSCTKKEIEPIDLPKNLVGNWKIEKVIVDNENNTTKEFVDKTLECLVDYEFVFSTNGDFKLNRPKNYCKGITILIISDSQTEGLDINDLKDANKFTLNNNELKLENNSILVDKYKVTMAIEKKAYKITLDTGVLNFTLGQTNRVRLILKKLN